MEPEWMKKIPSESICDFFYWFLVVYAVFAVLSLVSLIGVFSFMKPVKGMTAPIALQAVLTLGLATTMMLFHYLVCDRALLAPGQKEKKD